MQALYELGDLSTAIAMANDAELNEKISERRDYYMADPIHPTREGYLEIITPFMEKSGFFIAYL